MELVIALITLATAIIGLVATLAGRKQVIVVRDGQEIAQVPEERSTETVEERPLDNTVAPAAEIPRASSTKPARLRPEQLHWYDKPGLLVLSFLLFWPIGLYGIAKSRTVKKGWKIAVFVILALFYSVILFPEFFN